MSKIANRSQNYQHLFTEILVSSDMMEGYSNDESVYKRLNPHEYNEKICELEEKLRIEFWRVVDKCLTPRQREVLVLTTVEHMTQMECAKVLGVNQSSITKSLNGNVDYSKKGKDGSTHRVVYGGSMRKLRKAVENDDVIKEILYKISELREESWF